MSSFYRQVFIAVVIPTLIITGVNIMYDITANVNTKIINFFIIITTKV